MGRPLTPVSVAGVAARTVRRCAVGVYDSSRALISLPFHYFYKVKIVITQPIEFNKYLYYRHRIWKRRYIKYLC